MKSSSNSISSGSNPSGNCFSSKLRRFKIQESVLSANVNKCFSLNSEENDREVVKYDYDNIQLKKYFSKLKDNYQEVKHLFEEITVRTNDRESFEKTDIDELKRDILELETKIRTAKQFIRNELQALRNEENTLTEKTETSEPITYSREEKKLIRRKAPQIKEYKEIVPSPVRVIINSPFKCLEVQHFQDFMKNSQNRYGGWNEYNHNIFVQIWNKYYGDNNILIAVKSIEDAFSYEDFKNEVFHKISGSTLDSIDSHSKWYSEYLNLKLNQQKALNKWKENKRKIKPLQKARSIQIHGSKIDDRISPINTKLCKKQDLDSVVDRNINNRRNRTINDTLTESTLEHDVVYRNKKWMSTNYSTNDRSGNSEEYQGLSKKIDLTRLLKPTEQWLIKLKSKKDTCELNKSVESIAKLRTPFWRLNLCEFES